MGPLGAALRNWASEVPNTAIFEFFQEPMGGAGLGGVGQRSRSALSRWTHKRGLTLEGAASMKEMIHKSHAHFQPFAWIVDPLNTLQTAVHFTLARAERQSVVVLPPDTVRINHYVDYGSNHSRCLKQLGGCDVVDEGMMWAE